MRKITLIAMAFAASLLGAQTGVQAGGIMSIRFHDRQAAIDEEGIDTKSGFREKVVTIDKRGGAKKKKLTRRVNRSVYVVKEGDTISNIAQRFYGSRRMWKSIYTANIKTVEDPTRLAIGQEIILPKSE